MFVFCYKLPTQDSRFLLTLGDKPPTYRKSTPSSLLTTTEPYVYNSQISPMTVVEKSLVHTNIPCMKQNWSMLKLFLANLQRKRTDQCQEKGHTLVQFELPLQMFLNNDLIFPSKKLNVIVRAGSIKSMSKVDLRSSKPQLQVNLTLRTIILNK